MCHQHYFEGRTERRDRWQSPGEISHQQITKILRSDVCARAVGCISPSKHAQLAEPCQAGVVLRAC
jgi:hypothetical protein